MSAVERNISTPNKVEARGRCIVLASLLAMCLTGCATQSTIPHWPETLTYDRLDGPDDETLAQQTYVMPCDEVWQLLSDPSETLRRHYFGVHGPTGHGALMGTTVFFVVRNNEFWLHSNCGQGHNDGVLGPFKGDPRVVLAPTQSPER